MNDDLDEYGGDSHPVPPPPELTPALFREWRNPRFGSSNPERMDNPVWEWLVRSRVCAYSANEQFQGPCAFDDGPGWSFRRFGQTSTSLPDGRTVWIGGEHEDHYDPDFYIYNDVVVRQPDGEIEIFCYPRATFSPTDSHTATLVDDEVFILGNLCYPEDRKPGFTPVWKLDLKSFSISPVSTFGTSPGWIHGHEARLSDDGESILITAGKIDRGSGEGPTIENVNDWQLHLRDGRWQQLTDRSWGQWRFHRRDNQPNNLWKLKQALWYQKAHLPDDLMAQLSELTSDIGATPDIGLLEFLFQPDVEHTPLPEVENESEIVRINVQQVTVRYMENMYDVRMTVEGVLPEGVLNSLTSDLLGKLSRLENTDYEVQRI